MRLQHFLNSNFRSLTDAGLCWVEPCKSDEDDETFEEIEEDLECLLSFHTFPPSSLRHPAILLHYYHRKIDFVIKGNEPFFNLVSEQFYIQPPVPEYRGKANEGQKVRRIYNAYRAFADKSVPIPAPSSHDFSVDSPDWSRHKSPAIPETAYAAWQDTGLSPLRCQGKAGAVDIRNLPQM